MTTYTEGVPDQDGQFGTVDENAYHADRGSLSASGARILIGPGGPAKFRERMDNPPKPKREYDFGHLAHLLVLGKGNDMVVVDAPDYRSKAAREARDDAHANGLVPVLERELRQAQALCERVRFHPNAGPLFARGHAEVSFYTRDELTGVRLRARCDWMTLMDERLTIVDLKTSTTAYPDDFARKAADYGYHQQAAWYIDLVAAEGTSDNPAFLLAVVEKDAPHLVSVVEFTPDAIAEGRRLNRKAIDLYARCMESGEWPGYAPGITPITLPPWAFNNTGVSLFDLVDLDN